MLDNFITPVVDGLILAVLVLLALAVIPAHASTEHLTQVVCRAVKFRFRNLRVDRCRSVLLCIDVLRSGYTNVNVDVVAHALTPLQYFCRPSR